MQNGKRDRRLIVHKAGPITRAPMGEAVPNFDTNYGVFMGHQLQQRPTESWRAGQTAAQLETAWSLRWSRKAAAITARDRVVCDGTIYEIIGASQPQRGREIELVGVAVIEGNA